MYGFWRDFPRWFLKHNVKEVGYLGLPKHSIPDMHCIQIGGEPFLTGLLKKAQMPGPRNPEE